MKIAKLSFALLTALLMIAAKCNQEEQKQATQGIKGQVIWIEGNQMPSPGKKPVEKKGVKREIHIYELTKASQAIKTGSFYTKINSKLIKSITSNEDGRFSVPLPTGKYSIFVKEKNGLFANAMDSENHIQPIEVHKGKITEINIRLDYMAFY